MDRDLITRVVRQVFPPGTEVTWNPAEVAPDFRFWVVPGSRGPRWILPRDPRHGLPFLRQWRPYKAGSRLKWRVVIAAYRLGHLGRLPKVVPVGVGALENRAWDHFGWSGAKPPVPVIHIGTSGPARKAVAGLVDADQGRVVAVGKIPVGPQARRSILREVELLRRLEREKPGLAPRSLFADDRTGMAVQEAIEGKPSGRKATMTHVDWLWSLVVPGDSVTLRDQAERLAPEVAALDEVDRGTRDVLNRVISKLDDASPLPATWVHGDFAPWNLKRAADHELRAIDWEYASPRGLPLFDLVYHRSIQAFLFNEGGIFSRSVRPLMRRYVEGLGIGPDMSAKIVLACLGLHWLRCHREGDRRCASFLLRHLSAQLGQAR